MPETIVLLINYLISTLLPLLVAGRAAGPFYGIPFDTKTLDRNFLPFTGTGTCKAGTTYNFTDAMQLFKNVADLECIFNAGVAPNKVPEGVWYGKGLAAMSSRIFNFPARFVWFGKVSTKVDCDGVPKYFSFNNILGLPIGPAHDYVGSVTEALAPGEHENPKEALIVDYAADFKTVCPNYESYVKIEFDSMPYRRRTINSVWPVNIIYDVLRIVGRQNDKGLIFLGKSLVRDVFRDDLQTATVAWWYIVTYDPEVNPDFEIGQAIEQEETYTYLVPGVVDLLLRLLPFDNLVTSPLKTLQKMAGIGNGLVRSAVVYAGEFMNSFQTFFRDTLTFQRFFREGRDGRRRVDY